MEERGAGQTRHSRRGRMEDRVSVKSSSLAHRISVPGDRGWYVAVGNRGWWLWADEFRQRRGEAFPPGDPLWEPGRAVACSGDM